jgi:uncharacterized protein DUF6084
VPDLSFEILGAEVQPYAAAPQLNFRLAITNAVNGEPVHTVVLRCQIQIESARRRYDAREQKHLLDLFGEPSRWSQTLRTMLWTHTSAIATPFVGNTVVDLPVPCSFDFNLAATKYFTGLENGEVPLCLQFSGTVFYANASGMLQVAQISWEREARYRLPVNLWREMMEIYYPNTAWLCLRRDTFERLHEYKMRSGIPTWEQVFERIVPDPDPPEIENTESVN